MRYIHLLCVIPLAACLAVSLALAQTAAPAVAAEVAVRGDIPAPFIVKAEDLSGMPRETVSVAEQDGTKVSYEGVALREVLKRAGVPLGKDLRGKALASYVVAKAHDGYQGPFRLVCANDKAGARSVRMLETLEFVRLQK